MDKTVRIVDPIDLAQQVSDLFIVSLPKSS